MTALRSINNYCQSLKINKLKIFYYHYTSIIYYYYYHLLLH